jgi:hypothetical protein
MSDVVFQPAAGISPDGRVFSDDNRLHVRFFRGKERHGLQSEEQGRPIYVGVDMVEIRQPGERDVFHGIATGEHKMRFPRQWEAYQSDREHIPDGTPLTVIFSNEPETVETMKHLKIYTVEQLAALQENAIGRLGMGGRNLVIKAQKFMEQATSYQSATRMNREMEDMKSENDTLKQRLEALERLLAGQADNEDKPRRGPGRPPKQPDVVEGEN